MRKIYLICPVRLATKKELKAMTEYVENLEETQEYRVHFPPRDADQTNDGEAASLRICHTHREAMRNCDEIHVWLTQKRCLSTGSIFDLGMAFMIARVRPVEFVVANPPVRLTKEKSIENLLRMLTNGA